MMRPWNWLSRPSLSLVTVVMSTLNDAFVTVVPAIVIDPGDVVRAPDRGCALAEQRLLRRGSPRWTRDPIVHVPASGAGVALEPAVVDGVVVSESDSFVGGSPSMKWMYTNGPPTTSTSATTTPPTSQRSHDRCLRSGGGHASARFGRGGRRARSAAGQSRGRDCTFPGNGRRPACGVIDERRADRAHPPRRRRSRAVRRPALLFVPASEQPLPLVLLGHGAHLSKDDRVDADARQGDRARRPGRGRADGLPRARRAPRRGFDRRGVRARRRAGAWRDPRGRRGARRRVAGGRGRGARGRAASSRDRSATPGSRWARCSACRSSPTCPTCAPAVFALGGTLDDAHRRERGAQRARARRRAPARRTRGADAQHDARRALPDRRRHRGARADSRARSAWACGPAPTSTSRPRRSQVTASPELLRATREPRRRPLP